MTKTTEKPSLLSLAISGDISQFVSIEVSRRLEKENKESGSDTFTMGDIRRIKRDIYEGR